MYGINHDTSMIAKDEECIYFDQKTVPPSWTPLFCKRAGKHERWCSWLRLRGMESVADACGWFRQITPRSGSFFPHSQHHSHLLLPALHKPATSCGSRQREMVLKLTGLVVKVPVRTARAFLAAHISLPAVSFSPFNKPHTFYNVPQPIWEINFLAVLLGNGLQNTHKTPPAYTMQRFYGTSLWGESLFWVFSALPRSRTRCKPSYTGAAESSPCSPSDNCRHSSSREWQVWRAVTQTVCMASLNHDPRRLLCEPFLVKTRQRRPRIPALVHQVLSVGSDRAPFLYNGFHSNIAQLYHSHPY